MLIILELILKVGHIKIMETLMVKHFTIIPKLPIMVQRQLVILLLLSLDLSRGGSNGVLTFYKNGISMGTAYSNIDCTRDYFPAFSAYNAGKATCNFGQKPFKFPPPDGFQPITSSTVRSDAVVARSDEFVKKTVLYTGTGAEKFWMLDSNPISPISVLEMILVMSNIGLIV